MPPILIGCANRATSTHRPTRQKLLTIRNMQIQLSLLSEMLTAHDADKVQHWRIRIRLRCHRGRHSHCRGVRIRRHLHLLRRRHHRLCWCHHSARIARLRHHNRLCAHDDRLRGRSQLSFFVALRNDRQKNLHIRRCCTVGDWLLRHHNDISLVVIRLAVITHALRATTNGVSEIGPRSRFVLTDTYHSNEYA
jgi:hypothetical protein